MKIIKIQLKDDETAIKCADDLAESNVKRVRLGSAIVLLQTMHNTKAVAKAITGNSGYTTWPTKQDEATLLEVL